MSLCANEAPPPSAELIRISAPAGYPPHFLLIPLAFGQIQFQPLHPCRINPVNVQHRMNNGHLSAGNMGRERVFFLFWGVGVPLVSSGHGITPNLLSWPSVWGVRHCSAEEVAVTFVSKSVGGKKNGKPSRRLHASTGMNHCAPNVAED